MKRIVPIKKRTLFIALAIVVLLAIGGFAVQRVAQEDQLGSVATAPARRGRFVMTMRAEGEIKALRAKLIVGKVWGGKIIKLVPEGTVVQAGDPVVWLDPTDYERRLKDHQANLDLAESRLRSKKESGALNTFQKAMAAKRARSSLAYARVRLEEARIRLEKQLQLCENKLASRFSVEETELGVTSAELSVRNAETGLTKAEQDSASGITIQGAELKRIEAEVESAQNEVDQVQEDLDNTLLRAETGGMIIYALDWRGGSVDKPKERDEVRKGRKLMEIPDLSEMTIVIPILERNIYYIKPEQKARVQVDAFSGITLYGKVHKIATLATEQSKSEDRFGSSSGSEGVSVFSITILIDKEDLAEKQAMIAEMAASALEAEATSSESASASDLEAETTSADEVSEADAKIASAPLEPAASTDSAREGEKPTQIIPGLTAQVELLVDVIEDAVYIPREAVIEKDSANVVYVMEEGRPEQREIVLGPANENDVVVVGHLKERDLVCLRDPTVKLTPLGEEEE